MSHNSPEPEPIGSFKDAEREHARRMAALTPAQRVKIVCDMNRIALRLAKSRAAAAGRIGEKRANG